MDIHKSKPWHGLREFLKEYLIIVVGVLTALAAESGVEWLHWRHQVETTEERLTAEVRTNLTSAYTRLTSQRCYDERLARLVGQLRGHGDWHGAPIQRTPVPAPEYVPPYIKAGVLTSASPPVYMVAQGSWPDGAWTSAMASGVTLHMNPDRADHYARLYRMFALLRDDQSAESQAAAMLGPLAFDRPLSDAERTHFLEEAGRLSFWNLQQAASARGMIDYASAVGIRLRKSEVDAAAEIWSHYFLVRDCVERVPIPTAS